MSRIVLALGILLATSTWAQEPFNVPAVIIGTSFQCHVGIALPDGATAVPTQSVSLFEHFDLVETKNCANLVAGATKIFIVFSQPYNPGAVPRMRAMAFSEPGCTGLRSTPSLNACEVRHTVAAPTILGVAEPIAGDPSTTVIPGTIVTSGTTTMRVIVDPNGTALSAVLLHFTAQEAALSILSVTPTDPQIISSGPSLTGFPRSWHSGFAGTFGEDRLVAFEVGTLVLQGLAAGGVLELDGNYTDGGFVDTIITPAAVAFVESFEP